eukprot:1158421-Pelagomonas_calceolata.AAC.15
MGRGKIWAEAGSRGALEVGGGSRGRAPAPGAVAATTLRYMKVLQNWLGACFFCEQFLTLIPPFPPSSSRLWPQGAQP